MCVGMIVFFQKKEFFNSLGCEKKHNGASIAEMASIILIKASAKKVFGKKRKLQLERLL